MDDRSGGGERVVLIHVNFPVGKMEEDLAEFKELAISAGAEIVGIVTGTRRVPESKYFVGSGKAEEIRDVVLASNAQLVIFNHVLTPAQERNLEQLIHCRVLDRTGLILDIFAQRARSFEGKLQVELAFLKRQSTRLVRGWTHLERQRGGIGLRGGPGETQLEVDRRLIRNKIKQITLSLNKIRKQREQGRRARRKAIIPTIALVGYTNAGKSTLFNRLTGSLVYVANQLFATLDPTLRRVDFPEYGSVIFADTVGFIRHLPHDLVEAFHATLEEVSEADLLLHIVDASDENRNTRIEQVNEVLETIHAKEVPSIIVYNKIDLSTDLQPKIERDESGRIKRVFISASKGHGMAELGVVIGEMLGKNMITTEVVLVPKQAKLRSKLYSRHAVIFEKIDEEGNHHLSIRLPQVDFDKLFLEEKREE
ncbi:MAG: GTPase HflX [Gammaproteobacteria bacterium]|nr:GTPase HflX [Gammaproteobacteria bacterium]MCW5583182.1 GTPase HflX [Gammaproteobacteria bacterium]